MPLLRGGKFGSAIIGTRTRIPMPLPEFNIKHSRPRLPTPVNIPLDSDSDVINFADTDGPCISILGGISDLPSLVSRPPSPTPLDAPSEYIEPLSPLAVSSSSSSFSSNNSNAVIAQSSGNCDCGSLHLPCHGCWKSRHHSRHCTCGCTRVYCLECFSSAPDCATCPAKVCAVGVVCKKCKKCQKESEDKFNNLLSVTPPSSFKRSASSAFSLYSKIGQFRSKKKLTVSGYARNATQQPVKWVSDQRSDPLEQQQQAPPVC